MKIDSAAGLEFLLRAGQAANTQAAVGDKSGPMAGHKS